MPIEYWPEKAEACFKMAANSGNGLQVALEIGGKFDRRRLNTAGWQTEGKLKANSMQTRCKLDGQIDG